MSPAESTPAPTSSQVGTRRCWEHGFGPAVGVNGVWSWGLVASGLAADGRLGMGATVGAAAGESLWPTGGTPVWAFEAGMAAVGTTPVTGFDGRVVAGGRRCRCAGYDQGADGGIGHDQDPAGIDPVIVSEGSAIGLDASDVEGVDFAVASLPVPGEVILGDHREALAG